MATDDWVFVTHEIHGLDGMVRGFFTSRGLGVPASRAKFPGVEAVAVLPKTFDPLRGAQSEMDARGAQSEVDTAAATEWLRNTVQPGGNAAAVRVDTGRWLIGAWVKTG